MQNHLKAIMEADYRSRRADLPCACEKLVEAVHASMPGISTDPAHPLRVALREYEAAR